jgi:site-specific DNA-methyltransferase (adenine-specific)
MLINASRSRDILECIASLSSDEVATPPAVANQVLDLLPVEVWSNKDLKWLDPACKTGVFLREAARRLMEGLKDSIPDETERRKHIFTKMLHGYALTELTAQMSRRSLYYNKDASSKKLSVVPFKSEEGNIQFSGQDHPYNTNGKCNICGAGKEVFGAPGNRERHAYDFIHSEEGDMKFDVVVGNPPYQLESGGFGAQATPIYHLFIEQAIRLRPRYIAMIIPSRWFTGGMGLGEFRRYMLTSRKLRNLVDVPNEKELFPDVKVEGGVCYFLWDENHRGDCTMTTLSSGQQSAPVQRNLAENDGFFVRDSEAVGLMERMKLLIDSGGSLDQLVSPINPYGLATNFVAPRSDRGANLVNLHSRGGVQTLVDEAVIPQGKGTIHLWKVFVSKAYGGSEQVIGRPILASPPSASTMTYIFLGPFSSKSEAESMVCLLNSKTIRFLIKLLKPTQDLSRKCFKLVPILPLDRQWTEDEIQSQLNISAKEKNLIDNSVRSLNND